MLLVSGAVLDGSLLHLCGFNALLLKYISVSRDGIFPLPENCSCGCRKHLEYGECHSFQYSL
jgi:hypothetical protein